MSLTARVEKVVREEMRAGFFTRDVRPFTPIAADLDAEGEVLSARLDGHVTVAELAPLEAKHFYADINRTVWLAAEACAPGDLEGIAAFLRTRGYRGHLDREIENLVLRQPWVSVPRLRERATLLVELWTRRELVSLLRTLEADLCHGAANADQARRRFEARARELLG